MFGLGPLEMVIILAAALVFIGPGKLPEVARSLGKGMREMRRAVAGFEGEVKHATAPLDDPAPPEPPPPDPDSHEGLFPPDDPRATTQKAPESPEETEEPGPPDRVAQARPIRPAADADTTPGDEIDSVPEMAAEAAAPVDATAEPQTTTETPEPV